MRKQLAIFVAALMGFGMMACGKTEETTATNIDSSVNEDSSVSQSDDLTNDNESSTPTYAITSVSADDYDYFTGYIESIQITDNEHEALSQALDDFFSNQVYVFNKGVDDYNSEATEFNEENAKYAKENGYDYDTIKYENNITVSVIRCDSSIFSFVIDDFVYLGGAHGGTTVEGYTFDAKTGAQLEAADYCNEDTFAEDAKNFILDTISNSSEEAKSGLFDTSYSDTITEMFESEVLPTHYMDNRGVTFVFQQYDIAPYAAGLISFTMPFSMIDGFNEAYIPKDGFYTFGLSANGFTEQIDVDDDGDLESVSLVNTNNYEQDTYGYALTVEDDSVSESYGDYKYIYGYYIHAGDGNYILLQDYEDEIVLYEISNGIVRCGTLETELSVKDIEDGKITLAEIDYDEDGISYSNVETHTYSKAGIE